MRSERAALVIVFGLAGAACGSSDADPVTAMPDGATGSDARTGSDVTRDNHETHHDGGDAPLDDAPRDVSDASSDTPPDTLGPDDASDARESSTVPEALDGSLDARSDASDANTGPPAGCFHYSQGASPSAYAASVPRIAP